MKIRTITAGLELNRPDDTPALKESAAFLERAKTRFQEAGTQVQTLRLATQPWKEYLGGLDREGVVPAICELNRAMLKLGVDFLNIGPASRPEEIALLPEIIQKTKNVSASAMVAHRRSGQHINRAAVRVAAAAILQLAEGTAGGLGNFNFTVSANCDPGIPFFPAGYHQGECAFGLGLECSDLVYQAFDEARSLEKAPGILKQVLEENLLPLERTGLELEAETGIAFNGIDVSTAPSCVAEESLAFGFEKLGLGRFGDPGTLAVTGMITTVLKSLDVKICGYSGVMLPILEDFGLAKRCSEGAFNLQDILLYSAVCGTGLDCVPLPGDVSQERLQAIIMDMATLSLKLDKPLSARLFPVPGKKAGEMTNFESPYLVDARIMEAR